MPSFEITAVKNNAGPAGEDVVSDVTKTAFVAKTPEAFGYDTDGNLTSDERWTYTWDAENRLIACEQTPLPPQPAPRQKLEFAYDAYGRRVQKKVSTLNGTAYAPTTELSLFTTAWNLLLDAMPSTPTPLCEATRGAWTLVAACKALAVSAACWPSSRPGTYFTTHDGNGNVLGW